MAARRKTQTTAQREQEDQQLSMLRTAIAEGWLIEPPVLTRPSFSNRRGAPAALHCILVQADRRRLVVLNDTPAARALLATYHLGQDL